MKTISPALQKQYEAILNSGTAQSTRRAYTRDIRCFFQWLETAEAYPVSEENIIAFILEKLTTLRISTLRRYLSSLAVAHHKRGLVSPTQSPAVKLLLRRACATQSHLPSYKKAAITQEVLAALLTSCDNSLRGVRDKALMMVGFAAGGRRRNELAKLRIEHLSTIEGGYLIHIPSSKTDQAGEGHDVALLGKPAQALRTWLLRSGLREGYVFRGIRNNGQLNASLCGRSINNVIKRCAQLAGFDEKMFGAHSLRAGFITEASRQNIPLTEIMQLSGHKNRDVAQSYCREGKLLSNRASHLF